MNITVFTSNLSRHLYLLSTLATVADTVYAVQECNTIFPGKVKDFYNNSPVMQAYFSRVIDAQEAVFGPVRFLPGNVRQLCIKGGDLNKMSMDALDPALHSDLYVVFGASYIMAPLVDFLVERQAVNIHMGVSPYFRGSSCNFWAPYTGHPELVGATVHMLTSGLDSGDMLYHALPKPEALDPFVLGMKAVKVAHDSLAERIREGTLLTGPRVKQDRSLEMTYSRASQFTDEVAADYLAHLMTPEEIRQRMERRDLTMFTRPYIG